jgi:hypothetical protein
VFVITGCPFEHAPALNEVYTAVEISFAYTGLVNVFVFAVLFLTGDVFSQCADLHDSAPFCY